MARTAVQGRQDETESPFAELESVLGHRFRNPLLLRQALTHRSFLFDRGGGGKPEDGTPTEEDNETLEFVGDAVLGLIAAEYLWKRFPGRSEGELTQLRASIVSRRFLGGVGTRLGLGRWLRLGHTAEANGGRENAALFSNALEAVLAALYLDGGLKAARRFAEAKLFADALPGDGFGLHAAASSEAAGSFSGSVGDWKSALRERSIAEGRGDPEYRLISEAGPAHRLTFLVEVLLAGSPVAQAEGSSKKDAQREAARLAMQSFATAPGQTTKHPSPPETPPNEHKPSSNLKKTPATPRSKVPAARALAGGRTSAATAAGKKTPARTGKRRA